MKLLSNQKRGQDRKDRVRCMGISILERNERNKIKILLRSEQVYVIIETSDTGFWKIRDLPRFR